MHHRILYRISYRYCEDRPQLEQLKEALAHNRDHYDDIGIQSSFTHGVLCKEEFLRRLERIRETAAFLRPVADKTGIIFLATIGHHAENLALAPKDYTPLTDMYGNTAACTCCPNDPRYREEHLRPVFTAIAKSGLDFCWMDDDVRYLGHGRLTFVCFCDHCLKLFNAAHGTHFTRDELRQKLDSTDTAERIRYRKMWLEFSGQSVVSLYHFIEGVVHAEAPSMQLCAMDGGMHYGDNAPYEASSRALQHVGNQGVAPRWRPGGGAYADDNVLRDMVAGKSHQLGYEAAHLPDFVTDIESEVESFSYQRLCKSATAMQFEAALYTAAGATGTTWNILCDCDRFDANPPIMAAASRIQPFLERLTQTNGRQRPQGIWTGHGDYHGALFGLKAEESWGELKPSPYYEPFESALFYAGLPAAYRPQEAAATILFGDTAWAFADDELRDIFSSGVYCDAQTLAILEERGLADLAGFRRGKPVTGDAVEEFMPHPLTDGLLALRRDCHLPLGCWLGDDGGAYELLPFGEGAETLATLKEYTGQTVAACSCGLWRNALGGRVVVAGHCPLSNALFASRIEFLKRVFLWLSDGTLPAYVASYHKVALWARPGTSVTVANAALDAAEAVDLRVKGGPLAARCVTQDGTEVPLTGTAFSDGYTAYRLPTLQPLTVALVAF